MKYKVIGWTSYDYTEAPDKPCSEAALNAIIDDIKKNGYEFSGYYHQEGEYGVPVLNDGYARLFSSRGWGGVMAKAYGDNSTFGYASYAFALDGEVTPSSENAYDESYICNEDLNEDFEYSLSDKEYEEAISSNRVTLPTSTGFRYLDRGDRLTLVCGEKRQKFLIEEVICDRDIPEDKQRELFIKVHYGEGAERDEGQRELCEYPFVLFTKISKI